MDVVEMPLALKIKAVTLILEDRFDGGLRAWSPEIPGLVLSNRDPAKVTAGIAPALKFICDQTDTIAGPVTIIRRGAWHGLIRRIFDRLMSRDVQ